MLRRCYNELGRYIKINLAEAQRLGHTYAQSDMAAGRQELNQQERNTIRELMGNYLNAGDETTAKQLFDNMKNMLSRFDVSNLVDNNHSSMDIKLKNITQIQKLVGDF